MPRISTSSQWPDILRGVVCAPASIACSTASSLTRPTRDTSWPASSTGVTCTAPSTSSEPTGNRPLPTPRPLDSAAMDGSPASLSAAPALEAPPLGLAPRTRQLLSDYVELTKPKVQSLLLPTITTARDGAGAPSVLLAALTCLGGYLSAGGAGAVNHWFDRDIDARMTRTASRP